MNASNRSPADVRSLAKQVGVEMLGGLADLYGPNTAGIVDEAIIEASPAPHETGGKVPGAAAAVEAARQARLEQVPTVDPLETGVGV